MLTLERVSAHYGDPSRVAIDDVSLSVGRGEILAVLGANGAGKSTVLRSIARQTRLASGTIRIDDVVLNDAAPHEVCGAGIAYVPEGHRVFPNLTVYENLRLGAFTRVPGEDVVADLQVVFDLFPRLALLQRRSAFALSGGERQMVAIGRALMSAPKCLLLDEPSLGLAPSLSGFLFEAVRRVVEARGLAVLLVEQNWAKALSVAHRVIGLRLGRVVVDAAASGLDPVRDLAPALIGVPTGRADTSHAAVTAESPEGNG